MNFKKLSLSCPVVFAMSLSFSSNVFAMADMALVKAAYTLDETPIIKETTGLETVVNTLGMIGPIAGGAAAVVNTGKAIWSLIDSSRPSSEMHSSFATSVPNITDWQSLDSWKTPMSKTYAVSFRNCLGMTAAKFNYHIIYTYGGHYKGTGMYLTNVTVQASKIDLTWATKLSAKAEIPSVMNVGTLEDPIAGMMILISYQVSSLFTFHEDSIQYMLKGDGGFEALNLTPN